MGKRKLKEKKHWRLKKKSLQTESDSKGIKTAIVSSDEVSAYLNSLENNETPTKEGKGLGDREVYSQCVYKFTRLKNRRSHQPLIVLELTDQMNKRYPITHLRIRI